MRLLLSVLSLIGLALAVKLPSFMKKCKYDDAQVNACLTKSVQEAYPHFLKGYPELGIPSLTPFTVTDAISEKEGDVTFTISDMQVTGLENAKLQSISLDKGADTLQAIINVDSSALLGKYKLNGKLGAINVNGDGELNIMNNGLKIDYKVVFLHREDSDEFLKYKESKLEYEVSSVKITLGDLVKGKPDLTTKLNKQINDNWKQYEKLFRPAIKRIVIRIFENLLPNVLTKVPFKEIFD